MNQYYSRNTATPIYVQQLAQAISFILQFTIWSRGINTQIFRTEKRFSCARLSEDELRFFCGESKKIFSFLRLTVIIEVWKWTIKLLIRKNLLNIEEPIQLRAALKKIK